MPASPEVVPDFLAAALADRYRLDRELGRGGMATVYLAHDLRHGREVAIKVLHPDIAATLGGERFLAEIRTTATLHHPHIVPLLDSCQDATCLYYVMPRVEGESLRQRLQREGPLPTDEAVRLAGQVLDALAYAHAHGVIHRDVKPENILLQAGHALVADFGIARAVASAVGTALTQSGFTVGTPGYMSPEQALGAATVDARSDLYAVGAVLYEMLAGVAPYAGTSPPAMLRRQLVEAPPSVRTRNASVPAWLDDVIARALAYDPDERWPSAAAFAAALAPPAHSETRSTPPLHSIVVLPLASLSPDPADEFVADGLTDEIILELSRLRRLRVISRQSARRYRATPKDTRTIGRELAVRYVLEGSVRRAGDSLRVVVQLVEAETETTVFAERFVGTFADAQDILEQLARRIVATMQVSLSEQESARFAQRRVAHPEAFALALQVRKLNSSFDLPQIEEALQCARRALQIEPDNPFLIALLAYTMFARYNAWADDEGTLREALQLAERALRLDPAEPLACLTKGTILVNGVGTIADRVDGVHWLRRSAALEPTGEAGGWLAFVLSGLGRAHEGAALAERALVIDPLDTLLLASGAWAHLMDGAPSRAVEVVLRAFALQPDEPFVRWQAAYMVAAAGDTARAQVILQPVAGGAGIIGTLVEVLHCALARDTYGAAALVARSDTRTVFARDWGWSYCLAAELAMAGAHEAALFWLDVAVTNGWSQAAMATDHDGLMTSLRGDARLAALAVRMREQAASITLGSVEDLFVRVETPL